MLQVKAREYRSGIRFLQRAIAIDPEYWEAENNLGYAYLQLALAREAAQAFERAITIDPSNPIGYANLGISALHSSQFERAEECARKALRYSPDMPQAKALLGMSRAGQGDWSPEVHRLLEESRMYVTSADMLLQQWPESPSKATRLVVLDTSDRR